MLYKPLNLRKKKSLNRLNRRKRRSRVVYYVRKTRENAVLRVILKWLGREDSNLRMPIPKTGALDHLATPQIWNAPLELGRNLGIFKRASNL